MDKIRENIYDMLRYRNIKGLTDSKLDEFKLSKEEHILINEDIMVCFVDTLNKKVALKIEKDMEEYNVKHSLIVAEKITHSTKKYIINQINTGDFIIEMFLYQELTINISKHVLVKRHEIVSDETKLEILKKYKIEAHMLPSILITDTMCRYICGRLGDIIKITRSEETSGESDYFRLVVREN